MEEKRAVLDVENAEFRYPDEQRVSLRRARGGHLIYDPLEDLEPKYQADVVAPQEAEQLARQRRVAEAQQNIERRPKSEQEEPQEAEVSDSESEDRPRRKSSASATACADTPKKGTILAVTADTE